MPRATCRCGQPLNVPEGSTERVVCPKCGARVRVRVRGAAPSAISDGYIRFFCPCGRRLKVSAEERPTHGKCPDCGRVVPVPTSTATVPPGDPEALTEELSAADRDQLDRWAARHAGSAGAATPGAASTADFGEDIPTLPGPLVPERTELGLRVCRTCGKPLHLSAKVCRECGTPAPRR